MASKFQLDDIVLPDSRNAAVEFECGICLHIAEVPVMQTPCGHIYCQDCLGQCQICPRCREPLAPGAARPLSEVNKMGQRMMLNIRVRCPYSGDGPLQGDAAPPPPEAGAEGEAQPPAAKRPRSQSSSARPPSCAWRGDYGDLLAKHLGECPRHPVPCPFSCGALVFRGELDAHRSECELGFEKCQVCGDRVPYGGLAQHRREKAEVHVSILEAKLQEKESTSAQMSALSDRLARLEKQMCGVATKRSTRAISKRLAHLEEAVDDVASKEDVSGATWQKAAVWKVKGITALRRGVLRGKQISSPHFGLGGIDGFYLKFYPNGDVNAPAGGCSLYIYGPSDLSVSVLLTLGWDTRTIKDSCLEAGLGFGYDFPKAEYLQSDMLTIRVELQCSAELVTGP